MKHPIDFSPEEWGEYHRIGIEIDQATYAYSKGSYTEEEYRAIIKEINERRPK